MINDPVLVNDWHPVATMEELAEKSILRVCLLREELVLWQVGDEVQAWRDLCIHRGARLSLGKIAGDCLVCPYHGWTYNQAGRCVRIPAHPNQTPPAKAQAKVYHAQERYGLIWVCLGEPANDIPPFPEADDKDDRFAVAVCGPYSNVRAHGPRIVENFLDATHFAFVHEGVLGDPNHAEIGEYQARITPNGVESDPVVVYQPNPYGDKSGTVSYTYHAFRPPDSPFHQTFAQHDEWALAHHHAA